MYLKNLDKTYDNVMFVFSAISMLLVTTVHHGYVQSNKPTLTLDVQSIEAFVSFFAAATVRKFCLTTFGA